ncbi:CRISPR-associated endonuclease Cas2 [Azotobacter vinelandii]|uniref:CRISPR-associated endonuclease Cas2 n=1 Tax=Azotobacter vinelandii TaxID=354 RepID=UPI002664E7D8|nr:CRISPR-associated endonuclease Cas2 [Azotobacter vinelandii]WKN24004.1 CRISPR-associated endonuclease Cas2 [Azotobacter vinelandii]
MTPATYLLCYDIRDPRRLNRVFRACCKVAVPYQYSVFVLTATRDELDALVRHIARLIDENEDDVRVYRLHAPQSIQRLGEAVLPHEIVALR